VRSGFGVICSRAISLCLILLLPLTVGWKLWIAWGPIDAGEVAPTVAAFLSSHQFFVIQDFDMLNGAPVVITAEAGDCRAFVVETVPFGKPIDPVSYLATEDDHTFVVFRGATYDTEPVFLTLGNYVWYTLLCRLGLASHIPRVLAVISSCDLKSLPWSELSLI
jgi:hypothetical protein